MKLKIFVQGKVKSLGSDCIEKNIENVHINKLTELLNQAGINADPSNF